MLKEEKPKIQESVQANILAEEYLLQTKALYIAHCKLQDKKLPSSFYQYKQKNYR
jgi:hypothetical protein